MVPGSAADRRPLRSHGVHFRSEGRVASAETAIATVSGASCYAFAKTKLLQKAIAEIERLPESEQDAAAGALMDYLDHMHGLHLTDEQAAEVRSRMAAPGAAVPLSEARQRLP